jgi:hypothetical protein
MTNTLQGLGYLSSTSNGVAAETRWARLRNCQGHVFQETDCHAGVLYRCFNLLPMDRALLITLRSSDCYFPGFFCMIFF